MKVGTIEVNQLNAGQSDLSKAAIGINSFAGMLNKKHHQKKKQFWNRLGV